MTTLFSTEELRALLRRGEGQFVEFKAAWDRSGAAPRSLKRRAVRDLIAESVAAFANADGGTLLVGVEDDGAPSGHSYPREAVEDFMTVPVRRLRPAVSCRVERTMLDGHEILTFDVPIAPEAVMIEGNGFPYRVGSRTEREPQEVINRRKQAYRQVGYEPRVEPDATLEDLDLELVKRHLHRAPLSGRDPVEALEHYQLIVRAARGWRVTNAALLLFAAGPAFRWHPRAGVRMFKVFGRERLHGPRRNVQQLCVVQPPLASGLPEAIKIAGTHVRRTEKLTGMQFDRVPEYPAFAWEEAIVNAVAHRDYEVRGREIEVWFYDDRMEVSSPGGLLPEVTEERLMSGLPTHVSRNPLLVRVLADADFMREEGEGIVRIHEEMERRGLPPPEIEAEGWLFSIRLYNHKSERAAEGGGDLIREPRASIGAGRDVETGMPAAGAGSARAVSEVGDSRQVETRPVRGAVQSDIDLSLVQDHMERTSGVSDAGRRAAGPRS